MLFRSNNHFVYFLKNADCNKYSNGQSVSDKTRDENVHLQRGATKILKSNRAPSRREGSPRNCSRRRNSRFRRCEVLFERHSASVSQKIARSENGTFSRCGVSWIYTLRVYSPRNCLKVKRSVSLLKCFLRSILRVDLKKLNFFCIRNLKT